MSNVQNDSPTSSTPALGIQADHQAELLKRGIPPEYAAERGVKSFDLARLSKLVARAKDDPHGKGLMAKLRLPLHQTTGMLIEYQDCLDGVYRCRLRSDKTEYVKAHEEHRSLDETVKIPRYICQGGVSVAPYIIDDVFRVARDTSVPICIVEAPLKALSLSAAGMLSIGLGGVLAGAHDRDVAKEMDEILAHAELRRINWRGRDAFIVFDAGVRTNPLVALGAAYVGEALRLEGANVRILFLPFFHPQDSDPEKGQVWREEDQGPDDYLARNGAVDLGWRIIGESIPADPVERARQVLDGVTRRPGEKAGSLKSRQAQALSDLMREQFFSATLHVGGDTVIASVHALVADTNVGIKALRSAASEFQTALGKRQPKEDSGDYRIEDGKLTFQGEALTNFTAEIVAEVMRDDGDNRSRSYEIEGRLASGAELPRVEVPAREFAAMKWVDDAWGSRAIVGAGKAVPDHTRVAIQTLSNAAARTIYAHTGWRTINGEKAFLLPGGAITVKGKLTDIEVDVKLPGYACPDLPASNDEAQDAWHTSWALLDIAEHSTMVPLLAMTFLAPLRQAFGGLPFTLWLVAPTGSYKSTIMGLMQSHFGDFAFNNLPGSWFSTATALEGQMASTADVPFTVDNFIPPGEDNVQEKQRQLTLATRVIQTVGDGNTRSRCNSDGTVKVQRRPRCGLISTAEILQVSGESTIGRLFVVEGHRREQTRLDVMTEAQQSARLLGVNMAGYIQWLAGIEDLPAMVKGIYEPLRRGLLGTGHARTPTATAMLMTAVKMLLKYGEHIGATSGYDWGTDGLAYDSLVKRAEEQPKVEHQSATDLFLDALRTMLRGRVVALASKTTDKRVPTSSGAPRIGWLTETEVLLDPTETIRQVGLYLGKKWTYTDAELKRQLKTAMARFEHEKEVGYVPILLAQEAKQLTVQRTVSGGRARVWVVDRRLLAQETFEGLHVVDEAEDAALVAALKAAPAANSNG